MFLTCLGYIARFIRLFPVAVNLHGTQATVTGFPVTWLVSRGALPLGKGTALEQTAAVAVTLVAGAGNGTAAASSIGSVHDGREGEKDH